MVLTPQAFEMGFTVGACNTIRRASEDLDYEGLMVLYMALQA